jgi:hypothetical protein
MPSLFDLGLDPRGLSDFGLRLTLGESISTPNTLFASPATYACLAMGFPQLEFSANEILAWPRPPAAPAHQNNARQGASRYFLFLHVCISIFQAVNIRGVLFYKTIYKRISLINFSTKSFVAIAYCICIAKTLIILVAE